jgi:hypothetical protein
LQKVRGFSRQRFMLGTDNQDQRLASVEWIDIDLWDHQRMGEDPAR